MSGPGRVLVVGAGPTGLLLAVELALRGVHPRVVDAAAGPPWGESRALAVFPRTLEVLDRVDVAARLVEAGRRLRGARVEEGGRPLAELSLEELDTPFPFVLSVPQAETERVLLERLRESGIEVERPVRLVDLRTGADGVDVRLRSADDSETDEEARFDWVVGCDGAHSAVRAGAGIGFAGRDLSPPIVFSDCRVEGLESGDWARAFLGRDGAVAVIPLPGRALARVIATLPDARGAPEEGVPLPFLEDLLRLRSVHRIRLSEPLWSAGFEVRQRMATEHRAGRVVLAGDAAHVHSPVGGQGMNAGLRDAAALSWRLARVVRGEDPAGLLDDYVRERRPVARRIVRAAGLATRGVAVRGRAARAVRRAALRALSRVPPVRRRLAAAAAGLLEPWPLRER